MSEFEVWVMMFVLHAAHWRAKYAVERTCDEWFDLGGEA